MDLVDHATRKYGWTNYVLQIFLKDPGWNWGRGWSILELSKSV